MSSSGHVMRLDMVVARNSNYVLYPVGASGNDFAMRLKLTRGRSSSSDSRSGFSLSCALVTCRSCGDCPEMAVVPLPLSWPR